MTQHTYAVADQKGLAFLADVNAALAAIVTNNSGTTEPTATFPHMWWADTTAGVLKRRNAADSGWISVMSLTLAISDFGESLIMAADAAAARLSIGALGATGAETKNGVLTFADSPVVPADFCWMTKAIGEPFPLRDDLAGVVVPPTDNAAYRYIKLTAADAYNTGILTSESVSGSAPDVIATAVISLTGSPINGLTVNLLNTERRFIRAGSSGTVEADTFKAHIHGFNGNVPLLNIGGSEGDGPIAGNRAATGATNSTGGTETRPKNQGATFYMRIK